MSRAPGQPLVSVVIPTYNHQAYVLHCVNSVLGQRTEAEVEIIVVNDGSPDGTRGLLAPLRDAGLICLIDQSNKGQSAARNRGLKQATGEFIAFLDDDDYWPNDKLEWQLAELQSSPETVVVYGFAEIQTSSHTYRQPQGAGPTGSVFQAIAAGSPMRSPGQALIRADALRAVGGFDAAVWGVDDWDLFLRLSRLGQFKYVERLALRYREHDANASLKFFRMFQNALLVRDKHFGRSADKRLFKQADTAIRAFTTWDGQRAFDIYIRKRKLLKALGCLVQLLRIRGLSLRQFLKMCLRMTASG